VISDSASIKEQFPSVMKLYLLQKDYLYVLCADAIEVKGHD
jgi:hypothetical protein